MVTFTTASFKRAPSFLFSSGFHHHLGLTSSPP
uniref:Uncharacterized protein n=1 Tax=Myoviridae sp. ct5ra14 TaxID=2827659 RepID=A0A8S5T2F4_9CAUD|nr:MAG TPA: hypothetical protein [Myoviridae sp. ct5ra14]